MMTEILLKVLDCIDMAIKGFIGILEGVQARIHDVMYYLTWREEY